MKVFDNEPKGLNSLIRKIEKHAIIKAELKIAEAKLESDKAEVAPLEQFDSKRMFAYKRVKGRSFSYSFGRLSKSVQEALDVTIA
nr:ParB family protein [Photobacterium leiognathi]